MKKQFLILVGLICTLTVCADTFIKVTDASTLQDGDQVVLGAANYGVVSGGFTNKCLNRHFATFSGDTVTVDYPSAITLVKRNNEWQLKLGDEYLGHNASNTDMTCSATNTQRFSITITDGVAEVTSTTKVSGKDISFCYNSADPRFALYGKTSNRSPIELYRLDSTSQSDPVYMTYNIAQSAEYLTEGAQVFFGSLKPGENYVMGRYFSNNSVKGVAATYSNDRHSVTANGQYTYTVHRSGNHFLFEDKDGYYLTCDGNRTLIVTEYPNDKSKWVLGGFDRDDATVVLYNYGYSNSGYRYYLLCNHSEDMFRCYSGKGDGSNLCDIVIYSSEAPEWHEYVPDSWIKVDTALLDWGQQEMDRKTETWSGSRKVKVTVNELPEDAHVTLVADSVFSCDWTSIAADRIAPAEITVKWNASLPGEYFGRLLISCPGVDTLTVNLHAEALEYVVDSSQIPVLTVSVDSLVFELDEENDYFDILMCTFSVKNLKKNLYCKWEQPSGVLFNTASENEYMEIVVGSDELFLNNAVYFMAGQDYTDVELLVMIDGMKVPGNYTTYLHFYSFREDSKTEYAIDKTLPVIAHVKRSNNSEQGKEGFDFISIRQAENSKLILRDGHVFVLCGDKIYTITGQRVN